MNKTRPFVPIASTPEMRARVRELATPARDDFDRAVQIILDDFERLYRAYEQVRSDHDREKDTSSVRPPRESLPDCMMPDGAEPCRGFQDLWEEVQRLYEIERFR